MAKKRMIDDGIRGDEKVADWPLELELFWILLWGYMDDYGRGRWSPRLIRTDMFPLRDDIDDDRCERWLMALVRSGVIVRYEVSGRSFFYAPNWDRHQKLSRPTKSDVPAPTSPGVRITPIDDGDTLLDSYNNVSCEDAGQNITLHVQTLSTLKGREGKLNEGEGETRVNAPTPSKYCPRHPTGTSEPCWACKSAREEYEKWLADKPRDCAHGHHTVSPDTGQCVKCMKWVGVA